MQPDTTPAPGFTITTEPKADWWHLRAPSGRSVALLSDEELDEWGIDPSSRPPEPDEKITDFSFDRRGFNITVENAIGLTARFRCENWSAGGSTRYVVAACWFRANDGGAFPSFPSYRRDAGNPDIERRIKRLDRLVLNHPVLSLVAANYGISA